MSRRDNFITKCDQLMVFSFYVLICFLPVSIALSESFTGLAFFAYLLKRGAVFIGFLKNEGIAEDKKHVSVFHKFCIAYKPIPNILNVPILILLSVSLISVIQSQFLLLSIEGYVGKLLQSAFLYFNFVECMRTRKRINMFVGTLLVSCAMVLMNGVYQINVGKEVFFGHLFNGRVSSSFRHANDFGAYLVMIIPILFCLAFPDRPNKGAETNNDTEYFSTKTMKILWRILFLISLMCLGITFSRGAWVGLILGALLFGLTNRKALLLYGVVLIVFVSFFYPKLTENRNRVSIYSKKSFFERNNRLSYWVRATDIIKDYPYFGSGVNTYALVEGRYSDGWGGYPHNSFLQMAAETGLIGISAFLFMIAALFWDSLRALKRITARTYKSLLTGILTGLSGFLFHSFFDTNLYSVQLGSFFWVMMGFIAAVARLPDAPKTD